MLQLLQKMLAEAHVQSMALTFLASCMQEAAFPVFHRLAAFPEKAIDIAILGKTAISICTSNEHLGRLAAGTEIVEVSNMLSAHQCHRGVLGAFQHSGTPPKPLVPGNRGRTAAVARIDAAQGQASI